MPTPAQQHMALGGSKRERARLRSQQNLAACFSRCTSNANPADNFHDPVDINGHERKEANEAISESQVCCYCKNPCSGAHQCWKCTKPCHAIAPCSFAHDAEEGFGSKVTCCVCWLDDDVDQSASAVISTEPISNQNDEALSQFITEQIVTEDNNNINDAAEWASQTKRKRRAYSIQEKVEILDFAKKSSIHAASRHFGIDRNTVRDWKKQEAKLERALQRSDSEAVQRLDGPWRKGDDIRRKSEGPANGGLPGMDCQRMGLASKANDCRLFFDPDGAIPNGLALLKQHRQEEEVLKMVEEIDLGEDESDEEIDVEVS
ncbi:hypothetical protein niasHT_035572 [Heterodera trifolii]|uniref:SCAN domain-containing protein n=1 Tax=Heterodera trifolii TaxID=157864 RepID=A0ABD2J866_9BILA